jgi:2'-5' RNA ligase
LQASLFYDRLKANNEMPFAINIKASEATEAPLRALWVEFSQLEGSPSMLEFDYPPHITFAVYDSMSEARLRDALHAAISALPPFRLTFKRLAFFERPKFVVWAAPEPSESLSSAHAAIHRRIDPSLCWPHYRPRAWTPHCTLAMNILATNTRAAIARTETRIAPFDVVFDRADCVEFYPVRIIDRCILAS